MNLIQYASILLIGVSIGVAIMAVLISGRRQIDSERMDLIESQGLTIVGGHDGLSWGVVRQGILLGTGKSLREAVDNTAGAR